MGNFAFIRDMFSLGKAFIDLLNAFRENHGKYSLNNTFYQDLVDTCEELKAIEKDYNFYASSGICPNASDVIVAIAATAKLTTDPLMEMAAMGISLSEDFMGCKNKAKLAAYICYFGILAPVVKDIKVLKFSVSQYLDALRTMVASSRDQINFCTSRYANFTEKEKENLESKWRDDTNTAGSCDRRVRNILREKRASGRNLTSSSHVAPHSADCLSEPHEKGPAL